MAIISVSRKRKSSSAPKSKKLRDWTSRNAVLLPPFLTYIVLANGETAAEALLKIFSKRIKKKEAENYIEDTDVYEDSQSDKDNEKKRAKTRSTKCVTSRNATDRIAAECDDVLAFLLAVALKSRQVMVAPLSLRAYKRATSWFCQWSDRNLKHQAPPHKAAPQYHSGLTGFLSEVSTCLQNSESLLPVVIVQREADRETHGWYRLPPKS